MSIIKPPWYTQLNAGLAINSGLIGAWLFNDRPPALGSAHDLSGNSRHGTLVGNTHSVAGKFGNALEFDGTDDYVEQPLGLVSDYPFTQHAWIKTTTTPGSKGIVFTVLSQDETNQHWSIMTESGGGAAAGARNTNWRLAISSTNVTDGKWHCITGVFLNDTSRSIYVDGVFEAENTDSVDFSTSPPVDWWAMGMQRDDSPSEEYTGQIDHVLLYDRDLSAAEITSLYRDPFQGWRRTPIELIVAATSVGAAPPADIVVLRRRIEAA